MKRAVVDQPGLRVIAIGIFISLLFGFVLRHFLSNEFITQKIQSYLNEQIEIDQKFRINFESAEVNLSSWGIPFVSLQVQQITIESRLARCAGNQIYIDKMSIPLSFANIRNRWIENLSVSQVDIKTDDVSNCFVKLGRKTAQVENHTEKIQKNLNTHAVSKENLDPDLKPSNSDWRRMKINIDRFKIVDKKNYQFPIHLQNSVIDIVQYKNEDVDFKLKSKLSLFKDSESSVYKLKSDIDLKGFYSAKVTSSRSNLTIFLNGFIIDRPFDADFSFDFKKNEIQFNHHLKEISLKTLMSFLNSSKYELESYSGLNFSGHGKGIYSLTDSNKNEYEFSNLLISELDSRVTAEPIKIRSFNPLVFDPFNLYINHFDLQRFKNNTGFKNVKNSLNRFGYLSGFAHFIDAENFSISGKVEKMSFIFSNRGKRAYQTVDEFAYQIDYSKKNQKVVLNQFIISNQPISGKIQATNSLISSTQSELDLNLSVHKLIFSDEIYTIFGLNLIDKPQLDIDLIFKDLKLSGNLKTSQVNTEQALYSGILIKFAREVQSDWKKLGNTELDLQVNQIKIKQNENFESDSIFDILNIISGGKLKEVDLNLSKFKLNYQIDTLLNNQVFLTSDFVAADSLQKKNFSYKANFDDIKIVQAQLLLNNFANNRLQSLKVESNFNKMQFKILEPL